MTLSLYCMKAPLSLPVMVVCYFPLCSLHEKATNPPLGAPRAASQDDSWLDLCCSGVVCNPMTKVLLILACCQGKRSFKRLWRFEAVVSGGSVSRKCEARIGERMYLSTLGTLPHVTPGGCRCQYQMSVKRLVVNRFPSSLIEGASELLFIDQLLSF